MSARTLKLGAVGLGALTLACAGMQLPGVPQSVEDVAGLTGTLVRTGVNISKCDNLRSKVSVQEEYALGGAVALNWVAGGGGLMLAKGAERNLQTYLNTVGKNLAAQSSRPTLQWTFGVLTDAKAFNATSAPGGYVFVTRGLLKDVQNEAQLAGVLAHEIAHITLQHSLTRYDDVKVSQCKKLAGMEGINEGIQRMGGKLTPDALDAFVNAIEGSGALDLDTHDSLLGVFTNDLVEKLVTNGYAKEDEHAADEEAVRLLVSAGYDPGEYIQFLGKLPAGESNFAHHPSNTERQRKLKALLAKATKNPDEFSDLPAGTPGLKKPALPPAFKVAQEGK